MKGRCKCWRGGLGGTLAILLLAATTADEPPPPAVAGSAAPAADPSSPTAATEDRDPAWRPADGDDIPPPRTHYKGRAIAETMSYLGSPWLTRPAREREEHAEEMLAALHLKPGQVVCDFGCGNGYHTLRLAQRVGATGRVLAVDVQPEMLRLLEHRVAEAHLENVELVRARPHDPALPAGEIDLILMVDVYHELSYPEHVLRALRRALKPDGRLVLVEFREEDPLVPIKPQHKMSKWQILRELLPNGFRLAEQYDKLPWQHVMQFERAERFSPEEEHPDALPAKETAPTPLEPAAGAGAAGAARLKREAWFIDAPSWSRLCRTWTCVCRPHVGRPGIIPGTLLGNPQHGRSSAASIAANVAPSGA